MNTLSFNEIYENLKKDMIANQDGISDFNEGSMICTMFEAYARVVERLYIETRVGYANNLKGIPYSIFNFKKKEGNKATSKIKFTAEPINKDTIIPIGTKVASGELVFSTTELCVIKANETESNVVGVQAENVGLEYNVAQGQIDSIVSVLSSNVTNVENTEIAVGGTNNETETEMLMRFKNYINGLQGTSDYGVKSQIMSIPGVRSVSIIEHFPPENTFNYTVYVDDGTGGMSTQLKDEVELVLFGDGTAANPGYKAPGLNARVTNAKKKEINVTLTASVYRADHDVADFDITNNLREEINSLKIGENVQLTSLIIRLMSINYIKDVANLTINGAVSNYAIQNDEVARLGTVSVEYIDL